METAYLRRLQSGNQCELMFHLKLVNECNLIVLEADIHAVRKITDTVQSLLQHTINKINKMLEAKVPVEIKISLTRAGRDIAGTTICDDLIRQYSKVFSSKLSNNLIFKVGNQNFCVLVNAPLITLITLPHLLHVGSSVQASKFHAVFTDKFLCRNIWFTSSDKIVWDEVGTNYKYTPTINDLNKYLKLQCVPKNDNKVEGPPVEIISSVTVQEMCPIPKCPFEERHKLTNANLNNSSIRIVSYNTLSNLYTKSNQFQYCQPQDLDIDYRKQLIFKELIGYNADIICLQELDYHIFKNYLRRKLATYFKGIFHRKGNRLAEGLACFYCNSRFRLLEEKQIVFSEELRSNSVLKWTLRLLQGSRNLKDNIIRYPTSLQLTILMKKDTQDICIVANTHLYYHAEASDIRLIQAKIALDYISSVANRYKRAKPRSKVVVIFCGDFNSVPESPLYNFFNKGDIEHTFEVNCETPLENIKLKHSFEFESACGIPKYTNYTDEFKGCLDYIFYEKNKFSLIDFIPFPEESVLSKNTALPSKVFPSDHIALIANLQIL